MPKIAHATESAPQPRLDIGAGPKEPTFTTPAEPSFLSICGTRSRTADTVGSKSALGSSVLGTTPTHDTPPLALAEGSGSTSQFQGVPTIAQAIADKIARRSRGSKLSVSSSISRLRCMRRGVLFTARALEEGLASGGVRVRKAFITLTYREGMPWRPEHISATLACYVEWARRRGYHLAYAWVMELTQRGVPHYHIVMWLPLGVTPPLPDKQGWWKHGMSQAKWVRSPIGYLAKYLSKGLSGYTFPKGVRIWGSGGLTALQRMSEKLTTKSSKQRVLNMFYGYPAELIAQWCCISVQTADRYKRNILKPSKQSVALFRFHADKRIIPGDWVGWKFHDGKLFNPEDVPLTKAQLEAYQLVYQLASSRAPDEVAEVLTKLMIA